MTTIYSKKTAYDLWMFGVKGPGHYEFHTHEICEDEELMPKSIQREFYFTIPEGEHLKFIEEIGTDKSEFKRKFELIKLINGKKGD